MGRAGTGFVEASASTFPQKAYRIMPRSYYIFGGKDMHGFGEINLWPDTALARFEHLPDLVTLIDGDEAEAVFWIFVGDGTKGCLPVIAAWLLHRVASIGARIYIEHWFDVPEPHGDWPDKVWLPGPPPAR